MQKQICLSLPNYCNGALLIAMLALGNTSIAAPGERQSPINIDTRITVNANVPSIAPTYPTNATLNLVNTYNPDRVPLLAREFATLRADVPSGSFIMLGSQQYNLLQFHFHTPSEHTVNGRSAPMEAHFVHLRQGALPCDPDALLVIGARIKRGDKNKELDKIFGLATLPVDVKTAPISITNFDITKVLPSLKESWRYPGSLTAPSSFTSCSLPEGTADQQVSSDIFPENVNWIVLTEQIEMSKAQINKFRQLFEEGNSRQTQPLSNRTVIRAEK
jgi:carbonic anhydrase